MSQRVAGTNEYARRQKMSTIRQQKYPITNEIRVQNRFMRYEANLVSHIAGSGITALRRADHEDNRGEYYRAFFEIAVGLERIAKLILLANYVIKNRGSFPEEKYFRKFNHDIKRLIKEVIKISRSQSLNSPYEYPSGKIEKKIINNIHAFADTSRGRYVNFAIIKNTEERRHDPIGKWWREVGEEILEKHYYKKTIQLRVENYAQYMEQTNSVEILFNNILNENGEPISGLARAIIHGRKMKIIQRWSQFYTLTIVRWLACTLHEISQKTKHLSFIASADSLKCYMISNKDLKRYKNWPRRAW